SRTRQHAIAAQSIPTLVLGRAADAEVLVRAIESGAVRKIWPVGILSPSPADRGQSMRGVPVVGGLDELEQAVAEFAKRGQEVALHAILEVLATKAAGARIEGRLADVRDRSRILRLMSDFRPDLVFHAAALKHVPLLEADWGEGVKTNVFGSVNVADAAAAAGATAMVMISTDKAIEPVSVLGATKRFAEMYCQALDADLTRRAAGRRAAIRLIAVTIGNVLASN